MNPGARESAESRKSTISGSDHRYELKFFQEADVAPRKLHLGFRGEFSIGPIASCLVCNLKKLARRLARIRKATVDMPLPPQTEPIRPLAA